MKIGILTFHRAHNYGAVLQAFALQEFLKNTGHQVEMIDYRPRYLLAPYQIYRPDLSPIQKFLQLPVAAVRYVRRLRFNKFINDKLTLSRPAQTRAEIAKDYDAYILGSDQIWNYAITQGDPVFFGGFDRSTQSRLIAYAASTEATHEGATVDFSAEQHSLQQFSAIGVREEAIREQLQPLVDSEIFTVLDPTLLVDPSAFNDFAKYNRRGGHLLIYQVHVYENVVPIAKAVQRKMGIRRRVKLLPRISKDELLNTHAADSPADFVDHIRSADYIVTTSFHGTVFAIIFEKQFVCVMNRAKGNYRISSLLNSLGLGGRMIYSEADIPTEAIDYREVMPKLNAMRAASRAFLRDALSPDQVDV